MLVYDEMTEALANLMKTKRIIKIYCVTVTHPIPNVIKRRDNGTAAISVIGCGFTGEVVVWS